MHKEYGRNRVTKSNRVTFATRRVLLRNSNILRHVHRVDQRHVRQEYSFYLREDKQSYNML